MRGFPLCNVECFGLHTYMNHSNNDIVITYQTEPSSLDGVIFLSHWSVFRESQQKKLDVVLCIVFLIITYITHTFTDMMNIISSQFYRWTDWAFFPSFKVSMKIYEDIDDDLVVVLSAIIMEFAWSIWILTYSALGRKELEIVKTIILQDTCKARDSNAIYIWRVFEYFLNLSETCLC